MLGYTDEKGHSKAGSSSINKKNICTLFNEYIDPSMLLSTSKLRRRDSLLTHLCASVQWLYYLELRPACNLLQEVAL